MKNIFNKNKDASNISVPLDKVVHGVKVRKLPNGQYIKALNSINDLPEVLLKACFPGADANDILKQLQGAGSDMLVNIAGKLLQVVPEQFLQFISTLLDIPIDKLTDELSPNETLEIVEAYWEMNDLSSFFSKIKGRVMNLPQMKS